MSEFENNLSRDHDSLESITDKFDDIAIFCRDRDLDFNLTAADQQFFHEKGLRNPPKKCKKCKFAKNKRIQAINNNKNGGACQKIKVAVSCATYSANTTVPFYPSQGRPVFCHSCCLEQDPCVIEPTEN